MKKGVAFLFIVFAFCVIQTVAYACDQVPPGDQNPAIELQVTGSFVNAISYGTMTVNTPAWIVNQVEAPTLLPVICLAIEPGCQGVPIERIVYTRRNLVPEVALKITTHLLSDIFLENLANLTRYNVDVAGRSIQIPYPPSYSIAF